MRDLTINSTAHAWCLKLSGIREAHAMNAVQ
ncbi:hypothetical protein L584_13060 [Pantoea agglomerans Tx10]|nr:hypothetical protein L584_13060 [Pantoea agglomerans Tx10]